MVGFERVAGAYAHFALLIFGVTAMKYAILYFAVVRGASYQIFGLVLSPVWSTREVVSYESTTRSNDPRALMALSIEGGTRP